LKISKNILAAILLYALGVSMLYINATGEKVWRPSQKVPDFYLNGSLTMDDIDEGWSADGLYRLVASNVENKDGKFVVLHAECFVHPYRELLVSGAFLCFFVGFFAAIWNTLWN